jgi:undecaprenyl diphosphate synthase
MALFHKPSAPPLTAVPAPGGKLPEHVAIIMDGNGRWAKRRYLPRVAGHRAGVEAVRGVVKACARKGIKVLTLFAFSSENWRRPQTEVHLLMDLLLTSIKREVDSLHKNNIKLVFIGDRTAFHEPLVAGMDQAEALTAGNTGLTLNVAINYGGRWDVVQAARRLAHMVDEGRLRADDIDAAALESQLALHDVPEPDLFIRTGGEQRISNFLLWHLAYTELYFTDTLWPDFDDRAFEEALASFATRQRRFGQTGDQIEQVQGA